MHLVRDDVDVSAEDVFALLEDVLGEGALPAPALPLGRNGGAVHRVALLHGDHDPAVAGRLQAVELVEPHVPARVDPDVRLRDEPRAGAHPLAVVNLDALLLAAREARLIPRRAAAN